MGNTQGRVDWYEQVVWDGTTATDISVESYRWATFQTVGTGTLTWEATVDGTNWAPVQATRLSSGAAAQTATAEAIYRLSCAGLRKIRAGSVASFTSIHGRASA